MKTVSQTKVNLLFFIGSVALLLFTLESVTIAQNIQRIGYFDLYLIYLIQGHITSLNTSFMIAVTQLASPVIMIFLTFLVIILLLIRRCLVTAFWISATLVISAAIVNPLLKQLIGRPRPTIDRLIHVSGYSFPSGHSIAATVFYGMIATMSFIYLRKIYQKVLIGLAATSIIFLIMYSRVYLGVHYPTDVVGGFLLGTATVCFSTGFFVLYGPILHQLLNSKGWPDRSLRRNEDQNNLDILENLAKSSHGAG
ncbi:phosphatase PAP2 family protein [Sporolactobacillus putidus]|uniref:Phosphatase PAP2 family protein n=1 Tax=Sporolactobacillus putidus TaxID=492735 RepID=A0A917RZ85_9BACL|nr:phosphatase PAP2 family protein [Sporolactobacillus putidus]GGL46483.1 phosphatase PAP2 family protein [Sporolactobacillus putidus]